MISIVVVALLLFGGPVFAQTPPSLYSHNLSAGFWWDENAAGKFAWYLQWMESQGFKKQVRIVTPTDWIDSMPMLQVVQDQGWKTIAILDPGMLFHELSPGMVKEREWLEGFLRRWHPIIIGIEPMNEPWHSGQRVKPSVYGEWHRIVRQVVAPYGIPILAGNFSGHKGLTKKIWKYYAEAGVNWATDVDIITMNVTEKSSYKKSLKYLRGKIPGFDSRRVWLTEGDYRHSHKSYFRPEENFVYTCAGENTGKEGLNRCPEAP